MGYEVSELDLTSFTLESDQYGGPVEVAHIRSDGMYCGSVGWAKNVQEAVVWAQEHLEEHVATLEDIRPHSRGCGPFKHDHGNACSMDCPTCGGKPL